MTSLLPNTVAVDLEKKCYVAGELVCGRVFLPLVIPSSNCVISVRVSGSEDIKYTHLGHSKPAYIPLSARFPLALPHHSAFLNVPQWVLPQPLHVHANEERQETVEILDHTEKIFHGSVASRVFPFCFRLPLAIPSSIEFSSGDFQADIAYNVTACVEWDGTKQEVTVPLNIAEGDSSPRVACEFKNRSGTLELRTEEASYAAGSRVTAIVALTTDKLPRSLELQLVSVHAFTAACGESIQRRTVVSRLIPQSEIRAQQLEFSQGLKHDKGAAVSMEVALEIPKDAKQCLGQKVKQWFEVRALADCKKPLIATVPITIKVVDEKREVPKLVGLPEAGKSVVLPVTGRRNFDPITPNYPRSHELASFIGMNGDGLPLTARRGVAVGSNGASLHGNKALSLPHVLRLFPSFYDEPATHSFILTPVVEHAGIDLKHYENLKVY